MNSSARTTFPSLQLRPTSFVKALSILGLFIVVISYSYWSHLANIKSIFTHLKPTPAQTQQPEKLADHGWTQNILQTSKYPAENISSENGKYMKTWTDLNPGYQHKLLTDELIAGYVREHFHAKNPDIEETFLQAKDFVFQLDLIKYMALWAEGGVYSDLDVACVQPVSQWVSPQFIDKAGIVLGMQIEQKAGVDGNAKNPFQLADWTIMSKPNQPFLWFLYQRFTENMKHLAAEQVIPGSSSRPYNISDVTGRNAFTQAFLAYATSVTATKVTVKNFTEVTEPTLFGEVLVLPVRAFDSLVHHHEAGSWRSEPWDKLQPSLNEEQKMEEPKQKEVADGEKNVEAEKQKQEDINSTAGDQKSEEDEKVEASEEKEASPIGNSTSSTDVSTEAKTGQNGIKGTAEESNKASPADEEKPTSDKPPSVQYETAQAKDKPTANNKPPSVQYENAKVAGNVTESKHNTNNSSSQQSTGGNTDTKDATDNDTETKAEEETEAKEEAEKLKAQAAALALEQEKEKEVTAAKELAEAQEKEEEKKAAEAKKQKEEEDKSAEEQEKKAAEAKKQKEEEEKRLAEEKEKKKTAEPKWAPLNEAGKLASSNNLADYGAEFVPPD